MSKGVKKHTISKYSKYSRLGVDEEWMMLALGLDDRTPPFETIRRMYLFQELGIIKMR